MNRNVSKDVDSDSSEEVSQSKGHEECHICTDTATGRHYGAIACNGCKGFFRRTIRSHFKYKCRFKSDCQLDKHNRANCRFCRYMKCLSAGMRDDQVQMERDVIGKRTKPKAMKGETEGRDSPDNSQLPASSVQEEFEYLLDFLLKSESTIHNLRDTVIKQVGNVEYTTKRKHPLFNDIANLNDVLKSLHSQLLLVIEWAKTLPEFIKLSSEDQKMLLKNFAGQHVCLCVAYRSKETSDGLKLLNNRFIMREANSNGVEGQEFVDVFYIRDCEKVMDQLVTPIKNLNMDDTEFVALKACILFNPVAPGLTASASRAVNEFRQKILGSLDYYIRKTKPRETARALDLAFTVLTPLSVLASTISEDILFTVMSGAAKIDVLMEDLILAGSDYNQMNIKREVSSGDGDDVQSTSAGGMSSTYTSPVGSISADTTSNPCPQSSFSSLPGHAQQGSAFTSTGHHSFGAASTATGLQPCTPHVHHAFSIPPVAFDSVLVNPTPIVCPAEVTIPSPIPGFANVACLRQSPGGMYTQSSTTISTPPITFPTFNPNWNVPAWNTLNR